MENAEARMTKDEGMTNDQTQARVIRDSRIVLRSNDLTLQHFNDLTLAKP
jgi:hypothetical protein